MKKIITFVINKNMFYNDFTLSLNDILSSNLRSHKIFDLFY